MANLAIISIVHLITILIWALDSKTLDAMVRSYTKRSTYLKNFDNETRIKDHQFEDELRELIQESQENTHKEVHMQSYLRSRSNHPTAWRYQAGDKNAGMFKDRKNNAFELDRSKLEKEVFGKSRKPKSFFFWTWSSSRFFDDK